MKHRNKARRGVAPALIAILSMLLAAASADSARRPPPGLQLKPNQHAAVEAGLALMRSRGLTQFADLGEKLDASGLWMAARPSDKYLAYAEKSGDTPFAYTLPDNKHPKLPLGIVLAPRFFTDADPKAQAALMLHELAHWRAFQHTGRSTEYDGYKAEFDAHTQLGLGSADGLTYFMLLDGVQQYVVPLDKRYSANPEIKSYADSGK